MSARKRVLVQTEEQLSAVLADASVSDVYLDASFFPAEAFREKKMLSERAGKRAGLALPQIFRIRAEEWFGRALPFLKEAAFPLFLVRNLEEVLVLKEADLLEGAELVLDHTVYVTNREAGTALRELMSAALGSPEPSYTLTCSLELTFGELLALGKTEGTVKELTVYGRAPLMASAQCVHRTVRSCDRKEELLFLRDRTGAQFPVKNCCTFCLSTVYNSVPFVFYDREKEIAALSPGSIRYEFTTESADEVKSALSGRLPAAFTRGHMKRGVE